MITYLDSSVVLDRILDEPGSSALWREIDRTVCSVLVETECLRAFDRFRIQGLMDELALVRSRETLFGLMASCTVVESDVVSGMNPDGGAMLVATSHAPSATRMNGYCSWSCVQS